MKQTAKLIYEMPEILFEDMPAENGFLGSGDMADTPQVSDLDEVSTDWN